MKKYLLIVLISICVKNTSKAQEDTYLWLEKIDDPKSLQFVEQQNKTTYKELSTEKDFKTIYNKNLEILNSSEKIAYPVIHGSYVYNFWKDANHMRGIWRRSSLETYVEGKPVWETLLDIDKLSKKEGKKWVLKNYIGLYPTYNRFLIELSNGGGDSVYIREFDLRTKQFIENGFAIDEAKGTANYLDENTLVVSSNFGEGTLTKSGYPKQVRLWKRGNLLKDSEIIYEGNTSDVGTWGAVFHDDLKSYTIINQRINFFSSNLFVWMDHKITKLALPEDAMPQSILKNQVIIQLKSDWNVHTKTYKKGTLLSLNFNELLKGKKKIKVIIEPDKYASIQSVSSTKNKLLVNMLTNVTSQLYIYAFENEVWSRKKVDTPKLGTIGVGGTSNLSDQFFFNFQNFITPTTLYLGDAGNNTFKPYQSLPAYFDTSNFEVKQFKAPSKDGTMIPYFMVSRKDIKKNGRNPTLIYAYGGYEVSQIPFYSGAIGVSWLEKGGVYVLANIRGGGEYGPKWHQDGMKEKRQNVFDDLYAVSENLIQKKITSPSHLGVMGGSNGGLLVGVAFTQRPDLYNAIVCQVPLLDMKRYNKLLAGASWVGEFGNPDIPEEWAYLKKYSPYHNVKKGMEYPEVFFYSSTRDDRVHPGHARKMVAKMNAMGYKTYYYENTEGGHAGSSTNEQRAKSNALTYSYLLKKLK